MDMLFMWQFGWGVAGAALATTASQYISCAVLLYLAIKKDMLRPKDLLLRFPLGQWRPLLKVNATFVRSTLC